MNQQTEPKHDTVYVKEGADGIKAILRVADIHGQRHYSVVGEEHTGEDPMNIGCVVAAQHGPLPQVGINGFMVEHFIAAAKDVLTEFQKGTFPCAENKEALEHLDKALASLESRTAKRMDQGVEGKHEAHKS